MMSKFIRGYSVTSYLQNIYTSTAHEVLKNILDQVMYVKLAAKLLNCPAIYSYSELVSAATFACGVLFAPWKKEEVACLKDIFLIHASQVVRPVLD